jgi:hypothetical protein
MAGALRRLIAQGFWPRSKSAVAMALPAAESCVFIVGAARSGSTILQNALNDSPDIFLLGEPNFHTDQGTPDFAARYNAMHRSWSNQETKSSFCPPVLAGDGRWNEYLCQLAKQHRLVGAKTVITAAGADASAEDWFAFQCRLFFGSRYIFTFRDPLATLCSTQGLQRLTIGRTESLAWIMRNYLAIIVLYLRCLRILPNVEAICHEDADRAGFDKLESWLGVKLPQAHLYYDADRVQAYNDSALDAASQRAMEPIRDMYVSLRQGVRDGFGLPQLDQNNAHLNSSHFTSLGRLAREAEKLMVGLSADGSESITSTSQSNAVPSF